MDPLQAMAAFALAAAVMTVTPGLDTALVLRTAATQGPRPALRAGLGISAGVLIWGMATALGLGAVLATSEAAYRLVQIAGGLWLIWMGYGMLRSAWRPAAPTAALQTAALQAGPPGAPQAGRGPSPRGWFRRGLVTNLLNPKVGLFYASFLPPFLPPDLPGPAAVAGFGLVLAFLHALLGTLWFGALVAATRPLAGWLRRAIVQRSLDGLTGGLLLAMGGLVLMGRR